MNGESIAVTFDGIAPRVNFQWLVGTEGGLILESGGEEVSATSDGTNVIVNGEKAGVSDTISECAVLSGRRWISRWMK